MTFVADAVVIITSSALATIVVDVIPNVPTVSFEFYFFFTWYSLLVILGTGLLLGLYRSAFHTNRQQQNRIAGKVYLYSFLVILASFTVFKVQDYQRGFLLPFFAFLPFIYSFGRWVLGEFHAEMQRRGYGIQNTLIVGFDNGGYEILEHVRGIPELGYVVRGLVSKRKERKDPNVQGTVYTATEIEDVVKRERIEGILIPSTKHLTNGYGELVALCQKKKIKLKVLSPESEELLRFSKVIDIAGIPLFSPPRRHIEKLKAVLKRGFDVVGSLSLLLLLSPIFLLIMICILLEDGRPIFFKQKRALVKGSHEFYFLKFRSMVKDAERQQAELYHKNETTGGLFLLKDDPRVTRVGRLIRRFSLDELPQLINVLKGEMSLVGPRPLSIADLENISEENKLGGFYALRAKAVPGMTGLWQISGRREVSFKEMVLLDLYYIENQSLLFDLEILFATIPVVVFGKGAY